MGVQIDSLGRLIGASRKTWLTHRKRLSSLDDGPRDNQEAVQWQSRVAPRGEWMGDNVPDSPAGSHPCNFQHQLRGQPVYMTISPVRDLVTLGSSIVVSLYQMPAKSALQHTLKEVL